MPYPKVSIRFCTRCKWNLRSAWYVQELLQTFQDSLAEVSLIPGETGEFRVLGYKTEEGDEVVLWDRKIDGGFPDSKFLKQRVKSRLLEDVSVGAHVARETKSTTLVSGEECGQCVDCV
ncbi:LAFA_0A00408g1_1 [Lachancea sp. 'fantastica']|nr:LAFA_0A00408g1_1 [Lachancea sp. 'fantastica']